VFENRVLRRISEPRREEVAGEWRELHNVNFNVPYFSSNIIRMNLMFMGPCIILIVE